MDRSFEEIRAEVLEMDRESQERLVEEIEQQWSDTIDDEALAEAKRRLDEYKRGEGKSFTAEESIANVRRMLEEKKRERGWS